MQQKQEKAAKKTKKLTEDTCTAGQQALFARSLPLGLHWPALALPLALALAVTHSTLSLLLLRSDTRLNLGGAIGTFLLYSNSFFVLLHNFYTFCAMFFFFCCLFVVAVADVVRFFVYSFFSLPHAAEAAAAPTCVTARCSCHRCCSRCRRRRRHRHRWCVWTPTCCYFTRTRTQARPFRCGENI